MLLVMALIDSPVVETRFYNILGIDIDFMAAVTDYSKTTDHMIQIGVDCVTCKYFFTGRDRYFILHKGCLYYYNRPEATTTAGKFSLGGYRYWS